MKKNTSIFVVIGIIALLVIAGIYLYMSQQETKYNWKENYKRNSEEPYDLAYFYQLLKTSKGTDKFHEVGKNLVKHLQKHENNYPSNFVYIGRYYNVDDSNAKVLIDYIQRGNNVYLATNSHPYSLIANIFCRDLLAEKNIYYYPLDNEAISYDENGIPQTSEQYDYNSYKKGLGDIFSYENETNDSLNLTFNHQPFNIGKGFYFRYFYLNDYENYPWKYIDTTRLNYFGLCDSIDEVSLDVLGNTNRTKPSFIRINIGKGSLYLHCNPLVFSNYFMIEKTGYDYASRCMSYLNEGDIHWEINPDRSFYKHDNPPEENHSPIKYFLGQPALRWAWYLLLALVMLFLFFWSKRKQRVIPVLPRKDNHSLDYYATVSRLYFLNQNHHNLSRLMQRHFSLFVRKKFLINIHEQPERAIELLGNKTELGNDFIRSIFDKFKQLDQFSELAESDLIELYLRLQKFYNHCK